MEEEEVSIDIEQEGERNCPLLHGPPQCPMFEKNPNTQRQENAVQGQSVSRPPREATVAAMQRPGVDTRRLGTQPLSSTARHQSPQKDSVAGWRQLADDGNASETRKRNGG